MSNGNKSGLVVVDKEATWTSHDVVAYLRKSLAQKKVGHAGTLDPFATGVLLVGLGKATRLMRFLSALPKTYEALMVLGKMTTTGDVNGDVVSQWDMAGITLEEVTNVAKGFIGRIQQVPPMVSAIKVGGKRSYELARQGIQVEHRPREVFISELEVYLEDDEVHGADGTATFRLLVNCSSGTYIRALARDIGLALGGGAYLKSLRRLSIGSFTVDESHLVKDVDVCYIYNCSVIMRDYPSSVVSKEIENSIFTGNVMKKDTLGVSGSGPWAILNIDNELIAVYEEKNSDQATPAVVLS
ncbi:MAG: tRNA pseudouridine(55) synthase TruB [Actinobacteria bacterium]|nr:tRNA pseudouridine(55) synthase TruB [Actinomycetota bacterium]MCL6104730.1 tRNA pseudouridine(55) synthase TruB [Actinomycetota bacterium]